MVLVPTKYLCEIKNSEDFVPQLEVACSFAFRHSITGKLLPAGRPKFQELIDRIWKLAELEEMPEDKKADVFIELAGHVYANEEPDFRKKVNDSEFWETLWNEIASVYTENPRSNQAFHLPYTEPALPLSTTTPILVDNPEGDLTVTLAGGRDLAADALRASLHFKYGNDYLRIPATRVAVSNTAKRSDLAFTFPSLAGLGIAPEFSPAGSRTIDGRLCLSIEKDLRWDKSAGTGENSGSNPPTPPLIATFCPEGAAAYSGLVYIRRASDKVRGFDIKTQVDDIVVKEGKGKVKVGIEFDKLPGDPSGKSRTLVETVQLDISGAEVAAVPAGATMAGNTITGGTANSLKISSEGTLEIEIENAPAGKTLTIKGTGSNAQGKNRHHNNHTKINQWRQRIMTCPLWLLPVNSKKRSE